MNNDPDYDVLAGRLREAAGMMQRGVYSPGHIAVMLEAADALDVIARKFIKVSVIFGSEEDVK